jgi:hypothetical protein
MKTPNSFFDWAYSKRRELLDKMLNETMGDDNEMFIGFTRHTPVMITNGPEGLNGSVKGFGFVPKQECIDDTIQKIMGIIEMGKQASGKDRIKALIEYMYSEEAMNTIDFTRLVSLELARKHTWNNVMSGNTDCTLVYYEPPMVSYELRGKALLHENDSYCRFANAIHDIYHSENTTTRSIPAYVFEIEKIFDNSVRAFGKQIM